MTLLALYWSIMIACYLLASRLRKYAEKFKFVDKLMSLSVYALVLLMGLRMGADEDAFAQLMGAVDTGGGRECSHGMNPDSLFLTQVNHDSFWV